MKRRQRHYGSGHVRLVDGPYDGRRVSGFILRGRLVCAEGEYVHVLPITESQCLYWVEWPVVVIHSEVTIR